MQHIERQQKTLTGWVVFSLIVYTVFSLGFLGYGIWATVKTNSINGKITNETAFFSKNVFNDLKCIMVNESKKIKISCPVISTVVPFKAVTATYTADPTMVSPQNNENIAFNFQDGIHLPGMDISITDTFAPTTNPADLVTNFYNIDFNNDVSIDLGGSFNFGETANLNSEYGYPDYTSEGFGNTAKFRSFNLFLIGNFNDGASSLQQRCSSSLRIQGSSIYVKVSGIDGSAQFCSCVKLGAAYTEHCTPQLTIFGGISSAVS